MKHFYVSILLMINLMKVDAQEYFIDFGNITRIKVQPDSTMNRVIPAPGLFMETDTDTTIQKKEKVFDDFGVTLVVLSFLKIIYYQSFFNIKIYKYQ